MPHVVRFILTSFIIGFLMGWSFAAVLFWYDAFGLATLIAGSPEKWILGLMVAVSVGGLFGVAVTATGLAFLAAETWGGPSASVLTGGRRRRAARWQQETRQGVKNVRAGALQALHAAGRRLGFDKVTRKAFNAQAGLQLHESDAAITTRPAAMAATLAQNCEPSFRMHRFSVTERSPRALLRTSTRSSTTPRRWSFRDVILAGLIAGEASWGAIARSIHGHGPIADGPGSPDHRRTSMIADELYAEGNVAGLLCLGYPFHPPGKPEQLRTGHLRALATPTLICRGTRDPFGPREEVAGYILSDRIEILWIEDGDHDLRPRKKVTGVSPGRRCAPWSTPSGPGPHGSPVDPVRIDLQHQRREPPARKSPWLACRQRTRHRLPAGAEGGRA